MKKRFLSAFLAVFIALSVGAGAFAAQPSDGGGTVSQAATSTGTTVTQILSPSQIKSGWIEPNIHIPTASASSAASGPRLYASSDIPSSYNLVGLSRVTSVKNQGAYDTCWAFGAIASGESDLLTKSLASLSTLDLSELQLGYYTYNRSSTSQPQGCKDDTVSLGSGLTFDAIGGNDFMSISSLSRWVGAVNESDAPYGNIGSTLDDNTLAYGKNSYILSNAEMYSMRDLYYIKKEIMNNGAVSTAYGDYRSLSGEGADYYNDADYAYYNPDAADFPGNHEVCIVGWDDNYSKANFSSVDTINHTTAVQPSDNGAWLIKNSWGTSSGNNGYFWLSYDDTSLLGETGTSYQLIPVSQSYTHNYQYDGGLYTNYYDALDTSASMANVFTSTGSQALRAVSFWTLDVCLDYTVSIYGYVDGAPTSGTLISSATTSGYMESAGYHTVALNSSVPLADGEKFAVAVKFSAGDGSSKAMMFPYDASYRATDSSGNIYYTATSTSHAGQSYYYNGSNWTDISAYGNENFRIKAFTDDINITGISLAAGPEKTAYKTGETFDPSGTVLSASYSDGSTRNIAYNDTTKNDFTFSPSLSQTLTTSDTFVRITYDGFTVAQAISVSDQPETAASPIFSSSGGSFYDCQSVSITCPTSDATIRYTLDGTEPTTSSAQYTGPIQITSTTTIKAKAYKTGFTSSNTVSAAFSKIEHVYYGGVDYSDVYDWPYYINRYPDLKAAFGDDQNAALAHFVNCGMNEGRQGTASFDVNSYRLAYRDLRAAFGSNLKSYYMHYINFGKAEGRVATGVTTMQGAATVYNGVDYSAVYDYNYYTSTYGDIRSAFGLDDDAALAHFVNCGMNEGRQGSASFDVNSYRRAYRDLRAAFRDNLKSYYQHYIRYGKAEGRVATGVTTMQGATTVYNGVDYSSVYNYNYYTSTYGDIRNAFGLDDDATLAHFVNCGMNEGRQGSASFDVNSYRRAYRDLRAAFRDNLKSYYQHYIRYGKAEGRVTTGVTTMQGAVTVYNGVDYSAVYDYNYYTSTYGDIRSAFGLDDDATLAHFVNCGMNEGRQGSASFDVNVYRNNYSDLRAAFGDNLKEYYLHYILYGKSEGRTAV